MYCRKTQNMTAFPVSSPQRGERVGESASLFKHRAAIAAVSSRQTTRGQTTPQRSREEGLLDGGDGWSRRVAGKVVKLEIMTGVISWRFILGQELAQCFGVASVEKPSTIHKKTTQHARLWQRGLTMLRWMELSSQSLATQQRII